MSGVAIVRALLAAHAAVTAAVPAVRIFAGAIPLNTPLPAISITPISGSERNTVAMNEAKQERRGSLVWIWCGAGRRGCRSEPLSR